MGRRIYKYQVPGAFRAKVSRWLHAEMQDDKLCVWAETDDNEPELEWIVTFVGTGWELDVTLPDDAIYCGTVMDGAFVWHVFALRCENRDELCKYLNDNGYPFEPSNDNYTTKTSNFGPKTSTVSLFDIDGTNVGDVYGKDSAKEIINEVFLINL